MPRGRKKKETTEEDVVVPNIEEDIEEDSDEEESLIDESELEQDEQFNQDNICYYEPKTATLYVQTEKIFDRDDLSFVDGFRLNKLNYCKLSRFIARDYNLILENCDDFIYYLLDVKYEITKLKSKEIYIKESKERIKKRNPSEDDIYNKIILSKDDKKSLIEKIYKILELDSIFEFSNNFVEDYYTLNLDARINVNEKNLEYAITDKMNKRVLALSIIARLLIPLVCEIGMNASELRLLLTACLNKLDDDTRRTHDKLYKFISLRVNRTSYSDSSIWDFLTNRAVDGNLFICQLEEQITNDIVAKLNYNTSIVSFLDVVIRFKIRCLFIKNYLVNYKSIKTTDREMDDKDKMEGYMLKQDKYELYIHLLSIDNIVKNISIPNEYEYLNDIRNTFTTKLLRTYYNKDDYFDPIFAEGENRTKLILKMKEDLEKKNFHIIPSLIVSEIVKNESRINNRRKINDKVLSSKGYRKFLAQYRYVEPLYINNHPVMQLLSVKNYSSVLPNTGEELIYSPDELTSELFKLIL